MHWRADRLVLPLAAALVLTACGGAPKPPAAPVGRQEPPRAVETPPPDYPEALACEGIGGEVDLRITIRPDGSVGDIRVQRGSGRPELDDAAKRAVATWKFKPATRGGAPIPIMIAVPMTFRPPLEKPQRCFALQEQVG
ncbi:energy transducer TonB [Lysobacter humi (ex Lee et al. 2017)]